MQYFRDYVDKVCGPDDFMDLKNAIPSAMYTLMLISQNSKFYAGPSRVISMLKAISNEVMLQIHEFLQPNEIFSGEPEESIEKVRSALKIIVCVDDAFIMCKSRSIKAHRPWTFDPVAAFERFHAFSDRVDKLFYLFDTLIEFNKIEKIEIGNSRVSS
jgi:dynein heavy chain, axonemal